MYLPSIFKIMSNHSESAFNIIGISVRTNNSVGGKDIGSLWGKFMGEGIFEKIPNKTSYDIYGIYTDYESDHTGNYTAIVGCHVSKLGEIPAGMVGITIPKSDYEIFTAKGKMPECVYGKWTEIWENKELKRTYVADFEVYGTKSQNPEDAEVDIFISVK
jgi:predicted transcriptional regulator YdeE